MFYKVIPVRIIKSSQFIYFFMFLFISNFLYSNTMMKENPDSLIVTEHNNGDTIQVNLGTILVLKLKVIPGTGYAWHASRAKPNSLTPIEEPIFEPALPDTDSTRIGEPRYNVFRYLTSREGTELLELFYMRGWEKNKDPLKTFSITVRIQKK